MKWFGNHKTESWFIMFGSLILVFNILYPIFWHPLFLLNENQSLYLYSMIGQVMGTLIGLVVTALVFFMQKFDPDEYDETYIDAVESLRKKYHVSMVFVAILGGLTICLGCLGIIVLHTYGFVKNINDFILNQCIDYFILTLIYILLFCSKLLNPQKLDLELSETKKGIEKEYISEQSIPMEDFVSAYNQLEQILRDYYKRIDKLRYYQKPNIRSKNWENKEYVGIMDVLNAMRYTGMISSSLFERINTLRMYRNSIVHSQEKQEISKEMYDEVIDIKSAFEDTYEKIPELNNNNWNSSLRESIEQKLSNSTGNH